MLVAVVVASSFPHGSPGGSLQATHKAAEESVKSSVWLAFSNDGVIAFAGNTSTQTAIAQPADSAMEMRGRALR